VNAADELVAVARVVTSLLVVIALTVLAARLARRAGLRGGGHGLHVLDRVALTRDASLAVVRVSDRAVILGVTAHGVSVVTELPAAETDTLYPDGAGSEPGGVRVHRLPQGSGGALARLAPGPRAPRGRAPGGGVSGGGVSGAGAPGGGVSGAGTGSVLDPRTWRQGLEALRDLTARRGG
jgi:flagellar protein FliO/FliZ